MSTELVACPQCGTNLQNDATIAGQVVACPQCQTQLQMPALTAAQPAPTSALATPSPVPQLPQTASTGASVGINIEMSQSPSSDAPKAMDRLRRKSNPVPIIITAVIICILVVVGTVGYMVDRAAKQRDGASNQLIGNWESAEGGSSVRSLAFHREGQFQVLLESNGESEVLEGRWKVSRVRGTSAYVLVDWLDGTGETMIVQLSGGQLNVELPSVGSLRFRAAAGG